MNYRHAFHAGSFADVVKHALLARLVERLKVKETAFRVIDTHAGIGLYDLQGEEAGRTGEWRSGIGRLLDAALAPDVADLLAPYLNAIEAANPDRPADSPPRFYPGSPWLVRHLLRRQDRLTAVELHPVDAEQLAALFAGDIQVRTIALDGWLALPAFVPPKERRGLAFVDPPFEERDDFEMMTAALLKAYRRWPTGIYALWYPMKDAAAVNGFHASLLASGTPRLLVAELTVRTPYRDGLLGGTGLIVANPPWQFDGEAAALLEGLVPVLSEGRGASARVEFIAGEPGGKSPQFIRAGQRIVSSADLRLEDKRMRRTIALVLSALVFGANNAMAVDWGGFTPPQITMPHFALPSWGGLPDCAAEGVVYDVINRFGYVSDAQWHTALKINNMERIRETGYAPPVPNHIARRWCEAVAWLSNGQKPTVYYVIEDERNFAGLGARITYCLPGYDYWHVYGEACRAVKAGPG